MTKPIRYLGLTKKPPGRFKIDLKGTSHKTALTWGSDSKSQFVDVISVGPIGGIDSTKWDDVKVSSPLLGNPTGPVTGPFTHELSSINFHDGSVASRPWDGSFPYVERSSVLGLTAEIKDQDSYTTTTETKQVSGKGVIGVRVIFNTSGFTQSDDEGRRKHALAYFKVYVLDSSGNTVVTSSGGGNFYAKNPTSVPVTVLAPAGYKDQAWQYKVEMRIRGRNYKTPVSGGWTASIVTEIYRETQWYNDVAYASGEVISSDTSGSIPERTYIVRGYEVAIPVFVDVVGVPTFLGDFTNATSNSHAWNILAVLTDDKWAGDLEFDKINMNSFLEFEDYCAELVDGSRRYTFSQHLIKPTNYFKLASQMAGTADAKLYEDTSGRVGILIDKKTDSRRVLTSYDMVDEHLKITSVPTTKKLNYVQVEFDDKDNEYQKTIIHVEDSASITANGIIKNETKLDTVTFDDEAQRIASKMLAVSQFISDTYHTTVGPSHEDLQIGDILEVYDRKHSNVDFCGKIGTGSTTTVLNINPSTPIDLSDVDNIQLDIGIWNGTEVLRGTIASWTPSQITLTAPLSEAPVEFLSFGVSQLGDDNLSPILIKVLDLADSKTGLKVSGISYNHSLYDYVESGASLVLPPTFWLPDTSAVSTITSLSLFQSATDLSATWDVLVNYNYVYNLSIQQKNNLGINEWITVEQGQLVSATVQIDFPFPLNSGLYKFTLTAISFDGQETGAPASATHTLGAVGGGTLLAPDSIGVLHVGDPDIVDTNFYGRDFILQWVMTDLLSEVYEFRILLTQNAVTHTIIISDPLQRQYTVSEQDLEDEYGVGFDRDFSVDIFAIGEDLKSGASTVIAITNTAPPAPTIVIRANGDVSLSTGATLGDDVVESVVAVWESSDIGSVRPVDADISRSDDLLEHSLSDGLIVQDNRSYLFEVFWNDTFGEIGSSYTRSLATFDLTGEIPDAPELTQVTPVTDTSVLIRWEHDLLWLINMKLEYRVINEDLGLPWTEFGTIFVFPLVGGETNRGYDVATELGYVEITGLSRNTPYEFRAKVANSSSLYSDYSNVIEGEPFLDISSSEEIGNAVDDILVLAGLTGGLSSDPREMIVEGALDAFVDYEATTEIFDETVVREDENQKRIDSIDQIYVELDDPEVGVYALIVDTQTAVVDESSARASEISLVNVRVDNADASILDVSVAYADADTAIAGTVTQVQSNLDDATADITTIQQASVTTNTAVSLNATNLTAEIGTRISEITRVDQAIVDEGSARASSELILSSDIGDNETGIATARAEALAAIGYCEITPGVLSNHETKAACEAATGTWINAPLAQAVNTVEVVDGVGGTTTVGDFYEAYIDLEGEVIGHARLGVDGGGVFTGIDIVGGTSYSNMVFKAGGFQFKDVSDVIQLEYTGGNWVFSGDLSAAGGTFSGSLSAATGTFAGSLSAATGTFSGDISAATGTFTNNGYSMILNTGSFLIWYGTDANAASPTAGNAIWFLDNAGQNKIEISRTSDNSTTWSTSFTLDPSNNQIIVSTVAELEAYIEIALSDFSDIGDAAEHDGDITIEAKFYDNTTLISTQSKVFSYTGTYIAAITKSWTDLGVSATFLYNHTGQTSYASKNYKVTFTITDSSTFIAGADTKTLTSKFATISTA